MKDTYSIRKSNITELDYIMKLFQEVKYDLKKREIPMWTSNYPLDVIESDISSNSLFVLLNNDIIIGCFTLLESDDSYNDIKWLSKGKSLYIERVIIDPKVQGKGLSNIIMNYILEYAISNKYDVIRLTVLEANIRAHSLYEKYGFNEVDRGTHMTRSGRVAIAMEKVINKGEY